MKLAEALIIRGNLQSRLTELSQRLCNNAIAAEGEKPAEDPYELLKEAYNTSKELESLVVKINLTNSLENKDGITMTELLAKREALKNWIAMNRTFLDSASATGRRSRNSELVIKSTVNVKELQKSIDEKSMELRKLDVKIQELNWTTELKD